MFYCLDLKMLQTIEYQSLLDLVRQLLLITLISILIMVYRGLRH